MLEIHHYGPRRMGKLSELIALLRKLYKMLLTKAVIGKMNWIRFCWATEILPTVRQVKRRLSFFLARTVRDKLPTVPSTEDVSRNDDAVNPNRAQKDKMKTYADMKWRAKPTELKAGDDVLVKHTGTKNKLKSYWTNDLFTVTKVNRPTIIVRRKRVGKVFSRNISMVKKYKHINDSDDHLVIDSSDSAGMNKENPHPDDRESNTDSIQNVDSADNVRRSSCTRNHPIRFGEAYIHWKKLMKVGRVCGICHGLCMSFVCVDLVYGLCMWPLYILSRKPFSCFDGR